MLNLKKWMAKVSELLKSKSLTYTTKTVTTSQYGTASLGIYTGSDRLLEINTGTTDNGQQIVATPLLVGNAYWVKCTNANTGNVVANTPVLLQLVSCPVSFFDGGGNKLPYPLNRIAQILLSRKEVGVC